MISKASNGFRGRDPTLRPTGTAALPTTPGGSFGRSISRCRPLHHDVEWPGCRSVLLTPRLHGENVGSSQQSTSFKQSLPRYPVKLRVDPAVADRVRRGIRYARVLEEDSPDEHGWIPFHLEFEVERETCEFALGLAPHVQVVEPPSLCERVVHAAQAINVGGREHVTPASRQTPCGDRLVGHHKRFA